MAANKLTARQVSEMKRRWARGDNKFDIALDFDVSERTVRYHCKGTARPHAKPHYKRPIIDRDKALQLRRQGYLMSQIGQRLGFAASSISKALQSHVGEAA